MRWLDKHGRLRGEWRLELSDGIRFALPRKAQMAWALAFDGSYDAEARALLDPHIEPGTLVLDIGASLGLWTVPLGMRAKRAGARVLAFEPHPNNHAWLHRNITLNGLGSTVTVHETALGDAAGTAVMDVGEAGLLGGGGNAAVAVKMDSVTGVRVPITTLDSLSWTHPVSAIKIDVEGYEVRVLRGAADLIARDRPIIYGEFNKVWLQIRGDELAPLLEEMFDTGYDIFGVEHLRSRPWRPHNRTRMRPLARGEVAEDLLLIPR